MLRVLGLALFVIGLAVYAWALGRWASGIRVRVVPGLDGPIPPPVIALSVFTSGPGCSLMAGGSTVVFALGAVAWSAVMLLLSLRHNSQLARSELKG